MNWNDFEAVWKRQELAVGREAVDLPSLQRSFEAKRRKFAAMLLVRDWIEIAACAVVIVCYAKFWMKVGRSGWPMSIAILLVLGVGLVFLRERLRTRRQRLGPDAPLLKKIQADLTELQHQRRLLMKVWGWYIGPCFVAILVHAGVIISQASPGSSIRTPLSLVGVGIFLALLCWFTWAINRQSVRKQIEPRMEELEKLQSDLLSSN
jgi:hypothetical protein